MHHVCTIDKDNNDFLELVWVARHKGVQLHRHTTTRVARLAIEITCGGFDEYEATEVSVYGTPELPHEIECLRLRVHYDDTYPECN